VQALAASDLISEPSSQTRGVLPVVSCMSPASDHKADPGAISRADEP